MKMRNLIGGGLRRKRLDLYQKEKEDIKEKCPYFWTNPNTHNIFISSFEAGTVSYNYSTKLFKIKERENTNADHISS